MASQHGSGHAVLGISAYFHDAAAALVVNGQVVAAAQEERFSRRKGDASFPSSAIAYCLRAGGLTLGDVGHVVFYEKPLAKLGRLLDTYTRVGPAGWGSARQALPLWARHRISITEHIRDQLPGCATPLLFAEHHAAHAASAFFPSPYERAAVLVMDAVGEEATSSVGVGAGSDLDLLAVQRFPHSMGLLYSAFTSYLGFAVNAGEYKVMGLAPYGQPRFAQRILDDVVAVHDDGSLTLDMTCFEFDRGTTMASSRLHDLLGGAPRRAEEPISQRDTDVAASIQAVCELVVLRAARHAQHLTGERRLVMAGGVALNCVVNGRVRREGPFDDVWVQPASGDAGGALGAALLVHHRVLGRPRHPTQPDGQGGSLLGPAFASRDIGLFLGGVGARARHIPDEQTLLERVVGLLEDGLVVGWFQGRMEFGPRALGCRSIIADPRVGDMQARVNRKIKFRESFRPFAPSGLRDQVHHVFDTDVAQDDPYMVFTTQIRPEVRRHHEADLDGHQGDADLFGRVSVPRSDLPAVTHVDYSARVQTVDEARHGRYYRLLARFFDRTGCPVLLNTSFNVRGEPIVLNPEDAYDCFMATDMDCLVLEDHLLLKQDQEPLSHAAARYRQRYPYH